MDQRRLAPARWVPARDRAGVRQGTAYPLGGGGFSGASGRSAPLPARPRAGARLSLEESRRKEHQGGRGSSSLDPPFLGGGTLRGSSLFFCLACGPVSYARNGPPTGWAGWGGWFCRREGLFPRPKPSPWGEGAPVRTLGRMRGRSCTQPFLVDVEKGGSRLSPQRNASPAPLGNPVAPSSVTSGDSFPPRGSLRRWYDSAKKSFLTQPLLPQNANPNQGTQMGTETAPLPEQCATQPQNERVPTSEP